VDGGAVSLERDRGDEGGVGGFGGRLALGGAGVGAAGLDEFSDEERQVGLA
jgi:hypothetical protein